MPVKLVDNVKIYNTTTGTGAIVLGSPVPAYRGVEALTNGQVYSYSIHQGANYEYGRGTYLAAGQQLIRSPIASSTGGTALDLQPNAEVAFVALAEDIQNGPPALELFADRITIANDSSGAPSPSSQTTTFSAIPFNFTGPITWSLTDFGGTALTPVTDYLSSATGASVTMTAAAFTTGRGATRGVIVTATPPDGSGAAARSWTVVGTDPGINAKTLTVTASRNQIKYDSTGTATPSTQTTTLTANKQNTTATVTWTIADLSGAAVTPASAYLSADTGDSVTLTRVNFDTARGSTNGLTITATLTDGATISNSTTIVANKDGAAGANGADGYTPKLLSGAGLPANNQYANGDTYIDTVTGLKYGPKTNGAWPLGSVADVNAATPSRYKVDFTQAGATLPAAHWTLTRASSRTDMLYTDDYTYAYNTYGSGVPVIRAGKGLGVWQSAQQLLANPAAPVTETLTLNNTGVYILTDWGPPGSAMGVAFGTGTGTITDPTLTAASSLAGNAKSFLIITMTSTGTVVFTPSGGLTKANVTINPLGGGASLSQPVPFIPTQSTVPADWIAGTSTFNAMIGGAKGYFLVGVSGITSAKNYARLPSPLGLNGITASYVATDTTYNFFDVGSHHVDNNPTGNFAFSTGVTMARTWDTGQATVTYGAGDRVEASFPYTHNNGVAVTASCLGGAATTGTYANYTQINGWITGYEIATEARLSDEALYNLYAPTALPTLDTLIKGYTGPSQFKKFLSAYRKMKAGLLDHVRIVVNGPSHEAGYFGSPGPANVRAYSWPYQMVTDLIAAGYSITDDTFCGPNNYTDGATGYTGTNQYDSRITYSGTAPTKTGRQIGGEVIVIPAGTTRTVMPARGNTSRFIMGVYTAPSGYGSVEVSTDGGTTALVATETGIATNSTTAAAGVTTLTFNQTLGANAWTIKAVGGPVHVSFGQAYNPAAKQIVVFNTARDNWKVHDLALNVAPENSHLLGITTLAPALIIGGVDQTNDMGGGGTTYSSYSTDRDAIIANAMATADVVLFIDPRSNTATYTQTVQDTIMNYARIAGSDNALAIYDLPTWKTYAILAAQGMYSMSPLAGADNLHLGPQGIKRLKSNQMGDLLKRILATA